MVMSVSPPPPKSLRGQSGAGTWVPIGEMDRVVSVTNGACALVIPGVAIVTAYNSQTIAPSSGTITFSGNPQYPVNGLSVGQAVTCNAAGVIAAGTYITAVQ